MNRRWLLGSLFAATLSTLAPLAQALETQPYTAQALAAAQQAGQPVALHFHADWCPTCRQQTTVLNQLKADPALKLTVLVVNYDNEKDLRKALQVRTQSTVIVYKGATEKARIAGETAPDKIRAALQAAL
ncbi:thioredoxin family protein [Ideonella sp. 4Y11]|uniref:Thioredoxin family protein n=1 Tax=Ideonella aquatica TaxID=2824119 RepID=A0A941BGM9_9BURK|nr:thioredoxin family protein [Ideonella aquatica]MBQ0959996.1 thioredoxin family protein [Ideonella aquatica]